MAEFYEQPACWSLEIEAENVLCTSGEDEKEGGINQYTEFIDAWN